MTDDKVPSTDTVDDIDALEALNVKGLSPFQMARKRYFHHKGAAISTIIMAFLLIVVVFAPLTARYGVNQQVLDISKGKNQYLSPRSIAWMGTDQIGRDLFSRLIWGVRTSLFIGVASAILSVIIGTTVGSIAGLRGGWFDDIMMRVTDLFLAFPFIVIIIIMRAFLGAVPWITGIIGDVSSIRFIIALFAIFGWMGVARLVRGQVLALKEREFIEAARAVGASNSRIVISHLLPNSVGPILIALTLSVIGAIVGESTLSFFGLGPQPGANAVSLGQLVELSAEGAKQGNWWMVVFPCGALVLLAVCINFIGDGMRDAVDAKMDIGG
ncbi:MAG TPA: ABC transporter permease [Ilumatobacteraceae bacterium]|nr:ABC transporter permease [Ilumatobacteraceae bacterium]